MNTPLPQSSARQFSWIVYLFIVIILSWPFQIWYVLKSTTMTDKYLFSSIAMVMVSVATIAADRFLYRSGFSRSGWKWGKPVHYMAVLLFALLIWLAPVLAEQKLGINEFAGEIAVGSILLNFMIRFAGTLIPAFGEEFGWRGYLLPHLITKYGAKRAVILHAFIWWFWHLPVLAGMGWTTNLAGEDPYINMTIVLIGSLIPSMMHAVIFAYIWAKSESILVVTIYHAAFDEVRDALENSIGFGPLVNYWQMVVIIITGALLLWKVQWKHLLKRYTSSDRHLFTSQTY